LYRAKTKDKKNKYLLRAKCQILRRNFASSPGG
ncbi:MAG: hypothetical protein ACI976_002357, partial [Aureispira sp.]